jgi:tetratricopeptide (TPR) repeat protein
VVRAVVAYGLFAFATLQVAEPVLHALKLPDPWLTGLVALLGLGFPLTAALSWAFDLTRRGIVRTPEAPMAGPVGSAGPAGATGSGGPAGSSGAGGARSPRLAMAGVTVVAAGLGALLSWLALRPPAPVADADGRVSVAVADFANQTGEPALDALSGLLITSLEQSKKLKVLTRGRIIELLRQSGHEKVERIDEALARLVGGKAGVRALLLASIQRLGGRYVVELRALDTRQDHYLFTLREQAGDQAGILPLIDRLSERTRLELRESGAEVKAADIKVAEVVTPNLEAYRHFFRGKELAARLEQGGAVAEYRQALALEPSFAMASYELAFQSLYLGGRDAAALGSALQAVGRLPPREAGMVQVLDHFVAGRLGAGRGIVEALAARYPEDLEVASLAAEFLNSSGDYAASEQHYRQALRLSPDDETRWIGHLLVLQGVGRGAEGLAESGRHLADRPTPRKRMLVGLARLLVGDRTGALEALSEATADDPVYAWARAQALAAEGRDREALASLPSDPLFAEWTLAAIHSWSGRLKEAAQAFERSAAVPDSDPKRHRQFLATLLAATGDHAGARRALVAAGEGLATDIWTAGELGDEAGLARYLEVGPAVFGARFAKAMRARARGDAAGALAILRELDRPAGSCLPWFRGSLAAELGHHEEAIEALERLERVVLLGSDAPQHPWFLARGRLLRARALDRLGRRAEARALVELQLNRWKQADQDLPLLAEAKAVCKQVGCQAP